jgi:cell division transport system ATP-binding protein
VLALTQVSLEIERGSFTFLTGPSGAGKTTLLRIILGAEAPTAGQVLVGGRNLARLGRREVARFRRETGMVFQDARLLPTIRVLDNVAIAAEAAGARVRDARACAFRLLRELGLKDLVHRYPLTLSGGEQQRVAFARALVNQPALLLADEPTGNLDEEAATRIIELMKRANDEGTTVIVATHDPALLGAVPAQRVFLRGGQVEEPAD